MELIETQSWRNLFNRQGMIGVAISLGVHTIALLILACIVMSTVSAPEIVSLWGTGGDSNDVGSADIILDSEIGGDEGESAPLFMNEASRALDGLDGLGSRTDVSESMRVGLGGKGHGQGESGDGNSIGGGSLKVPGHAQTKGSFSAWTDPRDPKPHVPYDIVIQVKLPDNVKKFKASDLTGLVVGTDTYRKKIQFKSTDILPVENGIVQVRIFIPGADNLVRDSIRIESKMLKEEQNFEIEF